VLFGLYAQMMQAYKGLDFAVLIPFALGLGIFVFPFSRGVEFLLNRVFTGFFHIIIGFVLASAVFVGVIASNGAKYAVDSLISVQLYEFDIVLALTFIAGCAFSYWMCTVSKRYNAEESAKKLIA
jgi:putative membrane protein